MPTDGTDTRGVPRRSQDRQAAGCLMECRARRRASASPSAAITATARLRSAGTDTRGRSRRPPVHMAGVLSTGCRAGQQAAVRPSVAPVAMAEKRSGRVGTDTRGRSRRPRARRTALSVLCRAGRGTDASPWAPFPETEADSQSFGMEARGYFRMEKRSALARTYRAGQRAAALPSETPSTTAAARPRRLRSVGAPNNNDTGGALSDAASRSRVPRRAGHGTAQAERGASNDG
jgi:hypothetical protein